jgi:hypothetical protein
LKNTKLFDFNVFKYKILPFPPMPSAGWLDDLYCESMGSKHCFW